MGQNLKLAGASHGRSPHSLPTQELLDVDILYTNKHTMTGLGYLIAAILGSGTLVDGLACTPTSPRHWA